MGQKGSKLSQGQIVRLRQKTEFNEQEIKAYYRGFMKACRSGYSTIEQFTKIIYPGQSTFPEYVFRIIDTNKDGLIDFEEYLIMLSVTQKGTYEQKLKWMFSIYDLDGDGYISEQELLEVVTAKFAMGMGHKATPEEETDSMFRAMDMNRDGRVSLDEYISAYRPFFP